MSEAAAVLEPQRCIGGIPIRNLYIMLAYADALRNELSAATCGAMDGDAVPLDILAQLLLNKLIWLRRRGTPRRYRVRDDVNATLEGVLDLPQTLRGMHMLHNRVAFAVDELHMDTPHNRMLCAAIRALLRSSDVKREHALELRRQLGMFPDVSFISTSEALRVPWDRCPGAPPSYAEALGLARLALLSSLPDEGAHDQHWRKLLDDQRRMGELFEAFVRGFLSLEYAEHGRVSKPRFRWTDSAQEYVPQLMTDIVIESHAGSRLAVGDCKLNKSPLQAAHYGDKQRLRPEHLFQLFAYLAAARVRWPSHEISGLLIYALVDDDFTCDVMLREFPVRVRPLDLHQPWATLRKQLTALWPS